MNGLQGTGDWTYRRLALRATQGGVERCGLSTVSQYFVTLGKRYAIAM